MITNDEYVRMMHSKLDQLSHEIDKLVANAERIEMAEREKFSCHMEELRRHHREAQQYMRDVQQAGENAWGDMKAGMELAWEAIAQAIESARERFK